MENLEEVVCLFLLYILTPLVVMALCISGTNFCVRQPKSVIAAGLYDCFNRALL